MQTQKTQPHKEYKKDIDLRIIPLGGQEEVGRNMAVFEYDRDIVIVDMGIQFPEEDMPGIDYIIPNISYLKGKEKDIRAVVFTHGHLDHIGAAPLLLEKLGFPLVIGLPLTIALIKHRMEDHIKGSSKKLKTIQIKNVNEKINLNNFKLGFFEVEHSIMDSMGIVLSTPVATVIHMGDWTLGTELSSKKTISYNNLSQIAKPTILMIESLGATNRGALSTEEDMWENLRKIITQAPGRIIVATFATQVKRARDIISFAQKLGKKVAIDGYSMKTNIKVAQQLGYIKDANNALIDIKKIDEYPDNKVIILGTGAQGEARAVLSRIVTGNHKYVKLHKNDTVIFSSSIIPGNERTIQRLKDNMYRQCDNVIHNEIMNIHVSGHNNVEAIQEVVKQIRPTFVLPVYANHYLLKEAEKVIKETNFPEKNILILDNGHIIKFNKQKTPVIEKKKADTGYVFIDGLGSNDLEAVVLRDRRALSNDGIFVIIAVVDSQTGKVVGSPDIISRGFVHLDTSKNLLYQSRKKAVTIIEASTGLGQSVNWSFAKNNLREKIGDFLYQKTKKRPMILPVVIEV
ncbi:ribonuclease J [Patescibacteria group bacterium]|nr:ribonuclease J [Patescibacteria group bacterium]MBU4162402.1 ribonuclease J [Patescibacteria group bacterium]